MRDGWREIRLAEVLALQNTKLGVHTTEPPVLSLSKYKGIVSADSYFDKRIASESLAGYKVLDHGGWAYSTIHIDEGSIARNNLGISGVLSPMYTTMCWVNGDHDPRFFELLLRSPAVLASYRDHAQGTVNRRRSLPFARFASLPVQVPSLDEQRRIVDLIAAADDTIRIADRLSSVCQATLDAALSAWCERWGGPRATLGALAETGSGPSWKADDESREPQPGSVRVLGITNTPPSGDIDLASRTYVAGLPLSTRRLGASSLLMIRTNGNRQRIGNVYRVPSAAYGAAFSAFQIGLHLGSQDEATFVYWMLAAPGIQRRISESASGTTGLGNVAVGWLRRLEIPWPSVEQRACTILLFKAVADHRQLCQEAVSSLRTVRSALLSDLLSGDHEIPESYDKLLSA